jgi:hypothetical protein
MYSVQGRKDYVVHLKTGLILHEAGHLLLATALLVHNSVKVELRLECARCLLLQTALNLNRKCCETVH